VLLQVSSNNMALRQAYTKLISLRNFTPTTTAAAAVSAAGLSGTSPLMPLAAAQPLTPQQSRTAITVQVQNNKVPRALRKLTRTIYGDRLLQEWRDRQHFTKPAKRRFEAKKATELRLRKEEFREKLRWAMQRKARWALQQSCRSLDARYTCRSYFNRGQLQHAVVSWVTLVCIAGDSECRKQHWPRLLGQWGKLGNEILGVKAPRQLAQLGMYCSAEVQPADTCAFDCLAFACHLMHTESPRRPTMIECSCNPKEW
jgi:ribosomal protein S21